jgi:hypothetical protein
MAPSCHHTDPNSSDSMCVLLSFLTFFDYSHCIRHGMPRILFDLIVRFWIQLNDVSGGTKSPTVKIFTAQNKENKQKRFQDITEWQYVTICDNMWQYDKGKANIEDVSVGIPASRVSFVPAWAWGSRCPKLQPLQSFHARPRRTTRCLHQSEEMWRDLKIWKDLETVKDSKDHMDSIRWHQMFKGW